MLTRYFVFLLVQCLHTWPDDGPSKLQDSGIFIDYVWLYKYRVNYVIVLIAVVNF